MNKILAVSVLLGVTVMMMGSILPATAEHTVCEKGDPTCGHGNTACEKVREAISKAGIDKGTAKKIIDNVCKRK